jgi:phage terminase small subunit
MSGQSFRERVSTELALEDADPVWLEVLSQACAGLDDLQALNEAIAAEGLTIVGSKGQTAINPLVAERRQTRLAVARLLAQLGLADHETTSDRQRKNANARWRAS